MMIERKKKRKTEEEREGGRERERERERERCHLCTLNEVEFHAPAPHLSQTRLA